MINWFTAYRWPSVVVDVQFDEGFIILSLYFDLFCQQSQLFLTADDGCPFSVLRFVKLAVV